MVLPSIVIERNDNRTSVGHISQDGVLQWTQSDQNLARLRVLSEFDPEMSALYLSE